MELGQQLTLLESSKILKRLGVKQDSQWYWLNINSRFKIDFHMVDYPEGLPQPTEEYSAYSVPELLEKFPTKVRCWLGIEWCNNLFTVSYTYGKSMNTESETLADALAEMLILYETGKLDVCR